MLATTVHARDAPIENPTMKKPAGVQNMQLHMNATAKLCLNYNAVQQKCGMEMAITSANCSEKRKVLAAFACNYH